MAEQVYRFFCPRCSICGNNAFTPDFVLLHMDCGHVYCNYCIYELAEEESRYECVFNPGAFVPVYRNDELDAKARVLQQAVSGSEEQLQKATAYFQEFVNFERVPCIDRGCPRTCLEFHCPYDHEVNILSGINCRAIPPCWRGEYCLFAHQPVNLEEEPAIAEPVIVEEAKGDYFDMMVFDNKRLQESSSEPVSQVPGQKPETIPFSLLDMPLPSQTDAIIEAAELPEPEERKLRVQSRSALYFLMKNGMKELNKLLSSVFAEVPSLWIDCHSLQPQTMVRWVFQDYNCAVDFSDSDSGRLEAGWSKQENSCVLSDGATVFFKLMIAVPAQADGSFRPIARVGRLVHMNHAADIELLCHDKQFEQLENALRTVESVGVLEIEYPANMLLRVEREFGVSFQKSTMFGTSKARTYGLVALLDQVNEFNFPELVSNEVSAVLTFEDAQRIASSAGVVIDRGISYGSREAMQRLAALLKDFEGSMPMPGGIDDLELAVLLSKYNLAARDGLVLGEKNRLVAFAADIAEIEKKQQLQMQMERERRRRQTMESVPYSVAPEDVDLLRELFPDLNVDSEKITGPANDVREALRYLEELNLREPIPDFLQFQVIQALADKYNLRLSGGYFVGKRDDLRLMKEEINTIQVRPAPAAGARFQFHESAVWLQTQAEKFTIVQAEPESTEYKLVAERFSQTLQYPIVKIQKVQNRTLYIGFAHKHESYSESVSRRLEVKQLFHGTSKVDPLLIAQSDEGLDPRIGGGMWGVGSYYAERALYSHSYAYKTEEGLCQIFLCDVLVGDYIRLEPTKLKKPPRNERTNKNYHSVCGTTCGTRIWITYETFMSYPTFLITYRDSA